VPLLLVCVDGSASEEALACRTEVEALSTHGWTYPPEFVDQVDEVPVYGPDDLPTLRTVGVCIALPEPEPSTPEADVRRDVAALVDAMSQLAKRAGIEFAVEYREEQLGFLDGGPADVRVVDSFFGAT
jgi:hypothetical protein